MLIRRWRENGYEDAVVVTFGSDRDIRVLLPVDETVAVGDQAAQAVIVGESIAEMLQSSSGSEITLLGSDYVSAKVGGELVESGGIGMLGGPSPLSWCTSHALPV